MPRLPRTLVVVGHGMVAHRLIEGVRRGARGATWRIVALSEEDRPAYDRVGLSSLLEAHDRTPDSLALAPHGANGAHGPREVELRLGVAASSIDPAARHVVCSDGSRIDYDALVLATGARPFVPPVPGHDLPGAFTYRTVDDALAIRAAVVGGGRSVVVGGGLLGLEAASALRRLGTRPHVIETAPHLLPRQLDEGGARALERALADRGTTVLCGTAPASLAAGSDGRLRSLTLADGTVLDTSLVVFSVGVRPRDDLAAGAGLPRADRGGFLVDDLCRTPAPDIWAIGDCAAVHGRSHGLAGPGYRMADTVVGQLTGQAPRPFRKPDTSTELKVPGIAVASFGDGHARTPGALEFVHERHPSSAPASPTSPTSPVSSPAGASIYAKLVLGPDARTLLGGILVGDTDAYPILRSLTGHELPAPPEELLGPVPTMRAR